MVGTPDSDRKSHELHKRAQREKPENSTEPNTATRLGRQQARRQHESAQPDATQREGFTRWDKT